MNSPYTLRLTLYALLLFAFSLYPIELETDIEGEGAEELIEILEGLRENPVDVNTATKETLTTIPFITSEIADKIIRIREERGGFLDKEALSKVIPSLVFERIEPYITVTRPRVIKRPEPRPRPRIRYRTRTVSRYPKEEDLPGNPLSFYNRILVDYGRFSAVMLQEKDAGERDLTNFLAIGVKARDVGPLKEIIVGYYGLDFGEGLVLSRPVFTFKGSPYSMRRKGIHLFTITGENLHKRGIACKIKRPGLFDISLFYSNTRLDARDGDKIYYTYSARHICARGEERKDRVKEIIYGGNINIGGNFGITYYHASNYDTAKIRSYSPIGVNFRIPGDNFKLFGEVAYSRSLAGLLGLRLSGDRFRSDIIYRYLPKAFFSPHSSPFTDKRISNFGRLNDRGLYASIIFRLCPKTNLTMFTDLMGREGETLPDRRREYRVILNRRIVRGLDIRLNYRYQQKGEDDKTSFRLDLNIKPMKQLQVRLRTEWANKNDQYLGELVYGDILLHLTRTLSINYRHLLFDSDFCLWVYERDLPGVMGNKRVTGHGRRDYLLVRYRPFKFLRLSVKYEETFGKRSKLAGQVDVDIKG